MEVVDGGQTAKRGVKRMADESNLSDDQRFTKRFNLLTLDSPAAGNSHAYIPVQPSRPPNETPPSSDGMQIDDTRHRVYIGDLDAEIADIEAHEPQQRLIFLPDIEKHFSRIPAHVLAGGRSKSDQSAEDQQLVLYDVPKPLTSSEGHDSVRKAILEARRRAQDKATDQARQEELKQAQGLLASSSSPREVESGHKDDASDSDLMDIG